MSGAIIGGLLGAAGSIGGSALSASGAKSSPPQLVGGFDPRADPLLALLSAQASAGLGFAPDLNTIMAASPLNRLENSLLNSLGGKNSKKNLVRLNQVIQQVNKDLEAGMDPREAGAQLEQFFTSSGGQIKKQKGLFQNALSSAGFSDISSLLEAETAYRDKAAQQTSLLAGQAVPRAAARTAAEQGINKILTDYPVYGASELDQAIADAMKPLNAAALEQANYLGYNPATNIALTQQQGIRDALSILGGRQNLSNTALLGLQGELNQQNQLASGTSAQMQAALAQSANTASAQAMALNQLAQQSNLYQASALGSGVAAGLNQLGNVFAGLGSQPGTSTQGTRYQLGTAQYGPHGGGGSDVSGDW